MGQPKLRLPWHGTTIIQHVLEAWRAGGVRATVVVVPPDDPELADLCWQAGAEVVVPRQPPSEMKHSIQLAIQHIRDHLRPRAGDAWLVAPADLPDLSPAIVARLLATHEPDDPQILVPTLSGKRGHPVLFPWSLAGQIADLGEGEGLNVLVEHQGAAEIVCDDIAEPKAFADVDVPEDLQRGQPPPSSAHADQVRGNGQPNRSPPPSA
jgi:molybdenum cofactor cytidylyltransferase